MHVLFVFGGLAFGMAVESLWLGKQADRVIWAFLAFGLAVIAVNVYEYRKARIQPDDRLAGV